MVECPGFDADLAAAYLEQALVSFECRQFEEHLAACQPCRGHLRQLSRLADLADTPAPVYPEHPVEVVPEVEVSRWWSPGQWVAALTELWRRPAFGPAFGLAAVALVAAVVLWQWPGTRPAEPAASEAGEMLARLPVGAVEESSEPAGRQDQDLSQISGQTPAGNRETQGSAPAQSPLVTPDSARGASQRAARSTTRRGAGAATDLAARQMADGVAPSSSPSSSLDQAAAVRQLPIRPRIAATDLAGQFDQEVPGFPVPGRQSGDSGLMTVTNMQGKTSSAPARDRNPFNSAGPFSGYGGVISNSFATPPAGRSRSAGEETIPVASVKILRGKTFVFNGRYWVDQLSRELMTSRGTVDLVFGDEKYQQVVSENPGLAPYFELRPVIVVWNGRIYRVTVR